MNQKFLIATFAAVFMISLVPKFVLAEDQKVGSAPATNPAPVVASAASTSVATEDTSDETEFSFGTVKNVKDNQLVVSEYDYESNADVDVTYQIAPNATYENATSLKEIAAGDSVDIDYKVEGANKTAVAITVEKPLPADEEAALQTTDEAKAKE